ncbi:MAG: hypothetical protein GY832_18640 [Chloroflexi bacterium]|nr:hypothetical protein [Chloroflexota bacterium]
MSQIHRRLVCFAGSTVAIEYSGVRITAIIDFLYRYIPADSDVPPHMTYRVTSDPNSKALSLYRNDTLIYMGDSDVILAELLMGDVNYNLADQSRGGLLFHAAGLAWQGKGIILPGRMGAGKTTLTTWLVAQSLGYLTDELVFVSHGTDTVQTITRPLNVKKPSWGALQTALPFDLAAHTAQIWSTPRSNLIPPDLMRPVQLHEPPLGLIVFPNYTPDSEFSLRPLSKAQAGLALMECLINARNLPDHGLSEIARLAQAAPAYKLTYAHFDQIKEPIEALLQIKVATG